MPQIPGIILWIIKTFDSTGYCRKSQTQMEIRSLSCSVGSTAGVFSVFFAILMAYPKQHCIIISIISGNPFECLSLSLERRNSQLSEFQKEFCSQAENSLPSVLSSSS